MTRTVLVTGARGKTGREVAAQLLRSGIAVRAGSSAPSAEVRFDWDDPTGWPAATDGVDAIYLVRPDRPDAPELVGALTRLHPGIPVVLLSEQGADLLPPGHWARRVEDAVTSRASSWTLLRASWFHQVLTDPRFYRDSIRDDSVLSLSTGGGAIAWVDTRDIAAVAVAALAGHGEHAGRAYTLTGPAALDVGTVAKELSSRLGRTIHAEDPEVSGDGDPWMAEVLADLRERLVRGDFATVSPAVEQVTGRSPISIEEFIGAHADEWGPR
ncbi:hypothetical protein KOI35_30535 [Actinoplanes bogorensis]|uniref:Uncharacterized protein n=1 Tax=Paractinoplanes bogorensis TaxID=1610840 RepID=A0ABS5YWP1_9ACTN|nr:hypothetical protein [Actinoplanes bogorensis]MBU2667858.1 hypothetical protein [Actinoplanes bogorensis]